MGRANWHYDHPPACTCVACSERKDVKAKGIKALVRALIYRITGRKSDRHSK